MRAFTSTPNSKNWLPKFGYECQVNVSHSDPKKSSAYMLLQMWPTQASRTTSGTLKRLSWKVGMFC